MTSSTSPPTFRLGDFAFTPGDPCVTVGQAVHYLSRQELRLLEILAAGRGVPIPANELASRLRSARPLTARAVAALVHRLRVKLGSANNLVRTRRGRGYSLG